MPDIGESHAASLVVDGNDVNTVATLALVSPVRVSTPVSPAPLSGDGGHTWLAKTPPYPAAGVWFHVWTVVGGGAGRKVLPVQVGPDLSVSAGRSYATTTELCAFLREVPPLDADRLLVMATRRIDGLIRGALYAVTTDGAEMPVDTKIREAVRQATCALVAWWEQTGDASGAARLFTSASVGSVSVSRASGSTPPSAEERYGAEVLDILRDAGLLHAVPWYGP